MPSGLTSTSVVSRATRPRSLIAGGSSSPTRWRGHILKRRQRRRDVGRAVRADLPERLEWLPAGRARRAQPGCAHGTHEVRRLDLRATDGAALIQLREPFLHRLDLELALTRVLDVLGRP